MIYMTAAGQTLKFSMCQCISALNSKCRSCKAFNIPHSYMLNNVIRVSGQIGEKQFVFVLYNIYMYIYIYIYIYTLYIYTVSQKKLCKILSVRTSSMVYQF